MRAATCAVAVLLAATASATVEDGLVHPIARVPELSVAVDVGSDELTGPLTTGTAILFSEEVSQPGASWIRVVFGQSTRLSPGAVDEATLRLTSLKDGAVQFLNAHTLAQWQNKSAYFNGDTVRVELLLTERAHASMVKIVGLVAGMPAAPEKNIGICGNEDRRRHTGNTYRRIGRYLIEGGGGCSGWLIEDENTANGCALSAGHCGEGKAGVIQFQVPLSNEDGSVNHPAPEDQYSIDPESIQWYFTGVGNDMKYFGLFSNSNTGKHPYEAQGDRYKLTKQSRPGSQIFHTGYGVTHPRATVYSQTQKSIAGGDKLFSFQGNVVRYRNDVSGGDSGSAIEDDSDSRNAVGIVTHAGCFTGRPTTSNIATWVHHPRLVSWISSPRGVCSPSGAADAKNARYGTHFGGDVNFKA